MILAPSCYKRLSSLRSGHNPKGTEQAIYERTRKNSNPEGEATCCRCPSPIGDLLWSGLSRSPDLGPMDQAGGPENTEMYGKRELSYWKKMLNRT